MAASKSRYPVFQPEIFYSDFPHLNSSNHNPTSKATPENYRPQRPYCIYNCFAFVVGDKKKFWWPDYPYSYWPKKDAAETIEELMRVLQEHGYEECNGDYETGVTKVAIFAAPNSLPVHIAIQPASRPKKWMSKMGYNVDMEHDLDAIATKSGDHAGQGYGQVVKFMRLIRRGRKSG